MRAAIAGSRNANDPGLNLRLERASSHPDLHLSLCLARAYKKQRGLQENIYSSPLRSLLFHNVVILGTMYAIQHH